MTGNNSDRLTKLSQTCKNLNLSYGRDFHHSLFSLNLDLS